MRWNAGLLLTALLILTSACAPEFNDDQCETDQDCFPDETCSVAGRCIPGFSGDAGTDGGDVVDAEIAEIVIEPQTATVAQGNTVPLTAVAFDADGEEIAGVDFAWSSSDESVATVDADGVVTGVELGQATITAEADGVEATATVTVEELTVDRVEITDQSVTIEVGETMQLTARAFGPSGGELTGRDFQWSSANDAIATVNAQGQVSGVSVGTVDITASSEGKSDTVSVTVAQASVAGVTITSGDQTLRVGETAQLEVELVDAQGNVLTGRDVSWSSASPAVASVDSDGLVSAEATGTATITASANGQSDTVRVTVVANQPPVADAGSDKSVTVGDTVTLDASGSSDPEGAPLTYAWAFIDQPTGSTATLDDPGAIDPSFTPDVAGDYELELEVSDGVTVSTDTVLVVAGSANQAPVAEAGAGQAVATGATVTLDASSSSDPDGDSLTYTWAFDQRPTNSTATLSSTGGVLTSFVADEAGTYIVRLTVSDASLTATDTVTVTANTAPVADASGSDTSVDVGVAATLTATASSDADGDPLSYTWALTSAPTGSTATIADPSAETTTLTPDVDGAYGISLTVSDGVDTDATSLTLQADVPNTPPVAQDDAVTTDEDTALPIAVQATDVDGDSLTYTVTAGPTHGTLTGTAPSLTYTPDPDYSGPDSFTFEVSDSNGGVDSATVDITVNPVNDAPTADTTGSASSLTVGVAATLDASGSSDPEGATLTYSWTITAAPSGSTATVADPSAQTTTLTPDVAGTYEITLTVDDGAAMNSTDTAVLTLATANRAPVADAGLDATVAQDSTVTLDGTASADPDGDPLTYSWTLDTKPAGSTATLSAATTANPDFIADLPGDYVLILTVSDGDLTDTDTVIVTANAAPTADAGTGATVDLGEVITLDASGSSDPEGDALTYAWTIATSPGTATITDPSAPTTTITPDAAGTWVFEVTVSDAYGSDTAQVTYTVNAPPTASFTTSPAAPTTAGTIALDASGSTDADGTIAAYSWEVTEPGGATSAIGTGVSVTYAPVVAGDYIFILTVTDDDGATATDSQTVTVVAP